MKAEEREVVLNLRTKKRLSYGEIRKTIKVSKSTLSRWLKDFPLSDKEIYRLRKNNWQKGEASRELFRNTMRMKREIRRKEIYEEQMKYFSAITKRDRFIAGLILYCAEGSKTNNYSIVLTNTDSRVLSFYIKWVTEFLGISKQYLRVQLHLYENMNVGKERDYWSKILKIPQGQFYKDQVRKIKKNTYTYSEGFRHGTCQVSCTSGEKKMLLMESIRAFMDKCFMRV